MNGDPARCNALASSSVTVTVNPLPTVQSSASATRCGSGAVSITATPSTGVIDWYTVSAGGTSVTTSNTYTTPALSASTTYYAQARNSTTQCLSNSRLPVTVTVHTAVDAASISGASSPTCLVNTVVLTATASNATTFTWYKNGSPVQTGTSREFTVQEAAGYTVQGKNVNCTGATSAEHVVTSASIDCSVPNGSGFLLYQITQEFDGSATCAEAAAFCSKKGARCPTLAEARIMCKNIPAEKGGIDSFFLNTGDDGSCKWHIDCSRVVSSGDHDSHTCTQAWSMRCVIDAK